MANKKTDPVDRVMDSVDAFGSKIDELANKVAALAEKMGPEARMVFDETLQAYALKGLLGLIVMALATVIGIGFGVWAMVRAEKMLVTISAANKLLNSSDRVGDDSAGMLFVIGIIMTILGVVAGAVMIFAGPGLLVRWMHPLGSLILEKL